MESSTKLGFRDEMTHIRDEATEQNRPTDGWSQGLPSVLAKAGFWVGLVAVFWGLDTLTKIQVRTANGLGSDGNSRLLTEQATSAAAALVMVLFVVRWTRRNSFAIYRWWAVLAHAAGTIVFAAGHYAGMVLLRAVVYPFVGLRYGLAQDHLANFLLEYQKDVKIYLGIALVVAVGGRLSRPTAESPEHRQSDTTDSPAKHKLAVPTSTGERIIATADIDYVKAAGNYVSVHVAGDRFLIRSSLKDLVRKLPAEEFLRLHRSYLANGDKVRELQTSGSRRQVLLDGEIRLPVSKGYLKEVREAMTRRSIR